MWKKIGSDMQHSMICKKGSFITFRHDKLGHLKTKIPSKVWNDTEIEAKHVPLSGKDLKKAATNRSNEVRLSIRAPGVWKGEQQPLFYFRNIWHEVLLISHQIIAIIS